MPSTKPKSIPHIENLGAPEVYANEAIGFHTHAGCVHITFATRRIDHSENPASLHRVVVQRLIMPHASAKHFAEQLYHFLKERMPGNTPRSSPGNTPGSETLQ